MKKLKISIILFILISFSSICYASQKGIELKTTEDFKSNGNFKVVISINYSEINEGISLLQGQLEYDDKIFKDLKKEDITLANGWSDLVFNEENGMFIVEGTNKKLEGIQDVMYLNFSTKNVKNVEKTNIILKNIKEIGESEKEKEIEDAKLEVRVSDSLANTAIPFAGLNYLIIIIGIIIVLAIVTVVILRKKRKQ